MKYLLFAIFLVCCQMLSAQTSQVKVSMRNGTVITGDMVEFDPLDHITMKIGSSDVTIPMTEVAYVDNLNQSESLQENTDLTEKKKVTAVDRLADFKGFLLAKGNNVYVCSDDDDYEITAANDLKSFLKKDGFWNVVDNMIDAHFTISYIVNLRGHDKAYISIGSWRSEKAIMLCTTFSNESVEKNRRIVYDMYRKHVVSFQKKIEKGAISKSLKKDFTIE